MDDVSSSLPFLKPGLQTSGANKRLGSDSDEEIESNSQSNSKQNNTLNKNSSNIQMPSSSHVCKTRKLNSIIRLFDDSIIVEVWVRG
jgi:hypothetical protein